VKAPSLRAVLLDESGARGRPRAVPRAGHRPAVRRLQVSSEVGWGTTFRIYLPRAARSLELAPSAAAAGAARAGDGPDRRGSGDGPAADEGRSSSPGYTVLVARTPPRR
jgi:hypothetical protein